MTRVHHARPLHAPQRSIALDQPRAAVKKKKPYKIVLEAVTQEKKKLHSILTYASNAPAGFGFIPAGNPEITEWCKEQCRQRNLDVHIVSAKPKNRMHTDPEKLSHHVHRVGHHFPLEIISLACTKFGYTYDERHGLRKDKSNDRTNWIAQRMEDYSSRQQMHGRPHTEKEKMEHTRGAIREMFPKIPEADLDNIIHHAFQEGTNRVGNAKELSLARKVQLAVVAHIRHMYTDYDKILKAGSWTEARQKVEHVSLAKLKEWRDEAGDPSNEIEDTFREVIVLDDDEESSDEDVHAASDERESSMEIVSSRATARDLQPEKYPAYTRTDAQSMARVPRRTILVQPHHSQPSAKMPASSQRQSNPPSRSEHPRPLLPPYEPRPPPRGELSQLAHSRAVEPRIKAPVSIEGHLYHVSERNVVPHKLDFKLEPVPPSSLSPTFLNEPSLRAAPSRVQNGYVQPSNHVNSFNRAPGHSRRTSGHEVVLPSVERDTVDLTSPPRPTNGQPSGFGHRPASRGYAELHSPRQTAFPIYPADTGRRAEQSIQRQRYKEEEAQHVRRPHVVAARTSHHPPMELVDRPRGQGPPVYIDLTSSPRHLPTGADRGQFAPLHTYPSAPSGQAYVSVASRPSPSRERRGTHYEVIAVGEPPRTYRPSSGLYERRA